MFLIAVRDDDAGSLRVESRKPATERDLAVK
jgi:hypothetical protein